MAPGCIEQEMSGVGGTAAPCQKVGCFNFVSKSLSAFSLRHRNVLNEHKNVHEHLHIAFAHYFFHLPALIQDHHCSLTGTCLTAGMA